MIGMVVTLMMMVVMVMVMMMVVMMTPVVTLMGNGQCEWHDNSARPWDQCDFINAEKPFLLFLLFSLFFIWRSLRGCDYVVVDEHWKKYLDWETVLTMMVCVCWLVSIVLKWKTLISLLFGEECGQSAGKSWLAKSAERWREGDGAVWWGPLMLDDMVGYATIVSSYSTVPSSL